MWHARFRGEPARPLSAVSTMFILRWIFRTVVVWVVTRLLGRFLPLLARLWRIIFR